MTKNKIYVTWYDELAQSNKRLFTEFFSLVQNLDTTKYNIASDPALENINDPTLKAALWNSEIIISINDRNTRKYTFNFNNVDET